MPYIGKSPHFGVRNRFIYTATGDETSKSGADDNGATLTFTDGAYVDVYLNGVLLKPDTDYVTTTANTIGSLSALSTNDILEVIVYDVFSVSDTVSATSGGTFSGAVVAGSTLDMNGTELILDADADTSITADTDDAIDFKVAGSDVIRIDSSGNLSLGNGTNTNDGVIHINAGAGAKNIVLEADRDSEGQGLGNLAFHSAGTNVVQLSGGRGTTDAKGHFVIYTNDGSLTERFRIAEGGTVQVGKNTTSADDATTFQMTGSNGSNAAQTFTIFNDGANGNSDIKRSTGGGSSLSSWRINPGGYTKINYNLANANDAGGSNHEIGHANNDTPILNCYGSHSSFVSDILQTKCERSANSGYYFITCKSNVTSSSDNEFLLRGDGNAYADGSWSGSGADYAEFFETKDGKAIAIGTTVVLDGNKVRASTSDDAQSAILGVVRPKAINGQMHKSSMTIGNTAWNHWSDKYLTDDFQQYVMEEYTVTSWQGKKKDSSGVWHDLGDHSYETDKIPADGTEIWGAKTPPSDAVVTSVEVGGELKGQKLLRKKLNPDYDESKAYVNRENRDEWQIIGLLGQVQVLKGQKMGDRWIKMRDVSDTVEEYMIR